MNAQDIREIYEYNWWAYHLILEKAAVVTTEHYFAPSSHSFGSLHGTLVHLLDTDCMWLRLLRDSTLSDVELTPADFPTFDALRQRWQEEEQSWRAYIASLCDEDLTTIVRYDVPEGRRERVLWHCLYHVVNHGMQHRSEAANLLTVYGRSPGDLDFTVYLNERKAMQQST